MQGFTGKNISSSMVTKNLAGQPAGVGDTFANTLGEYEAALMFTGGTEGQGASPFDTFKPVDPATMNWENPGASGKAKK